MSDRQAAVGTALRKRPALVTVSGIITVVFCSIGILSLLWSLAAALIFGGPEQMAKAFKGLAHAGIADFYEALLRVAARYFPVTYALEALNLAIVLLGLAGGILLLKQDRRGVLLVKIYAIAQLAAAIASGVWSAQYLSAIQNALEGLGDYIAAIFSFAMYFGVALALVFSCSWPILILIFMKAKTVREFFTSQGSGA